MDRVRFRRAFRISAAVVVLEGIGYVASMILVASHLHGGTPVGTSSATFSLFGFTAFVARRNGYVSQVTTASWVIPVLIAIPVIIGLAVYFFPARPRMTQPAGS
jgi:hypothetical protein